MKGSFVARLTVGLTPFAFSYLHFTCAKNSKIDNFSSGLVPKIQAVFIGTGSALFRQWLK
jgi:hypothetical protein